MKTFENSKNIYRVNAFLYLRGTLVRREGFSWDYEAPNMAFFWNSRQTAKFLEVFLSLSDNM